MTLTSEYVMLRRLWTVWILIASALFGYLEALVTAAARRVAHLSWRTG